MVKRTLMTMVLAFGLMAILTLIGPAYADKQVADTPSVEYLHAFKAVFHAKYLKRVASDAGGTNKFIHTTVLPTEGTDSMVTPALDHLYSKAVLDLSHGPVYFHAPILDMSRYYSISVADQEHYMIYDKIRPTGVYAFIRTGYKGPIADKVTVIECPGDHPHLFVRTQVFDKADLPNTIAIQNQLKIVGKVGKIEFANPVQFTLDTHTVHPANKGLLAKALNYSEGDHAAMTQWLTKKAQSGYAPNNIGLYDAIGKGNEDPVARAVAMFGHLALTGDHALYGTTTLDCDVSPLHGSKVSVFTIPYKNPGVGEFWSITRYSLITKNTYPNTNDIFNAYNTKPDVNGNVTVTFSSKDPEDGTYWMPVKADEPYYIITRYYLPDYDKLVKLKAVCK
ncbi:DUF1254 domain-containing protein [Desulfosediminicola flagellatus]|uniref:DUF1254 domain-containing protein n=1 Tax=Desulfosediminicola flagellatus TaxID=2569541 RepID=UPI0010ACC197|nr:DUF1254 domain-containing protein [Desulfosediminicola flagellatus]